MATDTMFVVKRSGEKEAVAFEKVQERITKAAEGLSVNPTRVAQGVLTRMIDGITTTELDAIAANLAFAWSTTTPDYATLAARIAISNHQKATPATMLEVVERLDGVMDRAGKPASLLDPTFVAAVRQYAPLIESRINYDRDYLLDFFGFKTLEKAYLLRDTRRQVVERPQHLWMRVALGVWPDNLEKAFEMYDLMSLKKYTHATPTLFNAGTKRPQLSSCFLLAIKDSGDSIHGIYDTLKDCALISQYGGGIGIHVSNIRARGSLIRGTGGTSNGLVPMLRVYNNTARYVDQCFIPETLVRTEEAGSIPIASVTAGQHVLTSQGFHTVNSLVEHDWSGPMLRVTMHQETPGGTAQLTVQVTAEHPVLALQNLHGDTTVALEAKYRAGLVELDYIEISQLRVGDLIASPSAEDPTGSLSFHAIVTIDETQYTGKVYDFEVDAPHDYHVEGLGIAHNGGGKRNGSFAIYLEPWHADIEDFLEMKKSTGAEEERARDLFYGLWVPDLFMERVDAGGDWTLFCPNEAPGLADVVGAEFKTLYERYEAEGRGRKVVKAQDLWFRILDAQIETGTPYLLYKDAANLKSNQQNLGVIKSSNLCVAPETLILTKEAGEVPIHTLKGQEVDVWNGEQWSRTRVEQTGINQRVLSVEIVLSHPDPTTGNPNFQHKHLECTPYHKFLIQRDSRSEAAWTIADAPRAQAKDLRRGDSLIGWRDPNGDMLEALVWDVVDYGRTCDTYCFNEPLNHAGVFNGILTGNCTEIIEYSSPEETAVCNLASLSLPAFVKDGAFDFADFRHTVAVATRNLNRVIDVNFYPIPEARLSNMRHRPIGLGVQGLADVFAMLGLAWDDAAAADLNRRIFAHMYYAACEASCDLAAIEGPYETWVGSPAYQGRLQYDLWGQEPESDAALDWDGLVNAIRRVGMRNSLLVAPMPTASTSQILGNCECIEPYATHIFTRRTLAGEFIVVNRHLVRALQAAGVWSDTLKDMIIANNGSVQGLPQVPEEIQHIFKTVWEIKQKVLIDMAADRGPYVCQSQSLNLFLADADYRKLTSMHFYAWRRGLKTGIYYLRTKAAATAQKFTVDPSLLATKVAAPATAQPAECLMCSS